MLSPLWLIYLLLCHSFYPLTFIVSVLITKVIYVHYSKVRQYTEKQKKLSFTTFWVVPVTFLYECRKK